MYIYLYIYSSPDSLPLYIIIKYWVWFLVLCGRSLLEVFSFLKERNNGQACVTAETQAVLQKNLMDFTYLFVCSISLCLHQQLVQSWEGLPTAVLPRCLLIYSWHISRLHTVWQVLLCRYWGHSYKESKRLCLRATYLQVGETENAMKGNNQSKGIEGYGRFYFDREVKEVLSEEVTL